MFGLKDYIAVQSPEEGFRLLAKNKNNVILGGLLWMKMGKKQYHTGIDLKDLGLDKIGETKESIEIGSMVTLGQMEKDLLLSQWFGSIFSKGFEHIVGIQFRNLATIGGSVYSRFGFSDAITALLALNAKVHLHNAGIVSLEEFLSMSNKRDIILKIIIKKQQFKTSYQSHRVSATDFSILSIATSLCNTNWKISVGARPNRACLAQKTAGMLSASPGDDQIKAACEALVDEISFGTNQRGSKEYRQNLAKVLLKRGIKAICR